MKVICSVGWKLSTHSQDKIFEAAPYMEFHLCCYVQNYEIYLVLAFYFLMIEDDLFRAVVDRQRVAWLRTCDIIRRRYHEKVAGAAAATADTLKSVCWRTFVTDDLSTMHQTRLSYVQNEPIYSSSISSCKKNPWFHLLVYEHFYMCQCAMALQVWCSTTVIHAKCEETISSKNMEAHVCLMTVMRHLLGMCVATHNMCT